MNAQKAQEALEKLCAGKGMLCDYLLLKQLIDQANAKPKTLEELGWKEVEHNSIFGMSYTSYEKANQTIHFRQTERKARVFDYYCGDIRPVDLTYEEILAIAEKMKELGMTK